MVELIAKVLGLIPAWWKDRQEKADQVLAALYTALNETMFYANRLKNGERAEDAERQLSQPWFKAGLAVRRVDAEFADQCLVYGQYWTAPTAGVLDYAINHKTEIDESFNKLRELMKSLA